MNACLRQEAEARRRQLYIRTYSVTPLGPEGGLVEFVNDLVQMRKALLPLMERPMTASEWKDNVAPSKASVEQKVRVFKGVFLPRHPPVMGQWMRDKFPQPSGWYGARLSFTRTSAVMSMVGFVLGLGDRHTENILLDLRGGDVFHVDFDLLFNKGEELKVPELVPFRLTPNMVDGFGALGVEGPFRKACEVTMAVLRENKRMLLTVLQVFLHDPLVEWTKPIKVDKAQQPARDALLSLRPTNDPTSKKAEQVYEYIEDRLNGHITTPRFPKATQRGLALPLSVQSQVSQLIQQAQSEENLAQMFVGWCPFL